MYFDSWGKYVFLKSNPLFLVKNASAKKKSVNLNEI